VLLTDSALVQQQRVQSRQVAGFRYRRQEVPAIPAQFILHAALLITLRRIAVFASEAPVRAERDHSLGLFAPVSAQNLLHRERQVVVPQRVKHPAEVIEPMLVAFEKRLLRGIGVGAMKGSSARHAAHREELKRGQLSI
jgi:hypothetical protein